MNDAELTNSLNYQKNLEHKIVYQRHGTLFDSTTIAQNT